MEGGRALPGVASSAVPDKQNKREAPKEPAQGEEMKSEPRATGSASNKAGAADNKRRRNHGSQINYEKDAKDMLGKLQSSAATFAELVRKRTNAPAQWSWAKEFFDEVTEQTQKKDTILAEDSGFFSKFTIAALSGQELKKLKKDVGGDETYNKHLLELCLKFEPVVKSMAESINRIISMEEARAALNNPTPKVKAKPKPKAKTRASPRSEAESGAEDVK